MTRDGAQGAGQSRTTAGFSRVRPVSAAGLPPRVDGFASDAIGQPPRAGVTDANIIDNRRAELAERPYHRFTAAR